MAAQKTKTYRVKFETEGFKGVAEAFDKLNERMSRSMTVRFESDGLAAVVSDFESVNKKISEALESYRKVNKTRVYLRDDRGRFAASRDSQYSHRRDDRGRFAERQYMSQSRVLAADAAARREQKQLVQARQEIARRMGFSYDNSASIQGKDIKGRARVKGRFYLSESQPGAVSKSASVESAQIQGRIIGEYAAKAIREREGVGSYVLSTVMTGILEKLGGDLIGQPIVEAIERSLPRAVSKILDAQDKSDRSLPRTDAMPVPRGKAKRAKEKELVADRPTKMQSAGGGIRFAASSVLFGALQEFGAGFSRKFVDGFVRGFDKKADKEFEFQLERRGEIFGGAFVDFAKNIGKDIDAATEEMRQSGKDFSQTAKSAAKVAAQPFDTAVRSYRMNALETIASQRAKEQAAQQQAPDLSGKEEAVFIVGGFAGMRGKVSGLMARRIKEDVDPSKVAVIPVSNEFTDISKSIQEDPTRWGAEVLSKVTRLTAQGFNSDAVNMAAQVLAAIEKNPEIKIRLVGHSAGGFVAEEAEAILKSLGVTNIESVALGTPNTLGELRTGQRKYMGTGDPLFAFNELMGNVGLAHDVREVGDVPGHGFLDYYGSEQIQDLITRRRRGEGTVDPEAQRRWESMGRQRNIQWAQLKAQAQMRRAQEVQREADLAAEELRRASSVAPPPQDIPIQRMPDTPRPVNIPIDIGGADPRVAARQRMERARAEAQRQFESVEAIQAAAEERSRQFGQQIVRPDVQPAPIRESELPQLVKAYQQKFIKEFKASLEQQMRSLFSTMELMKASPVEDDDPEFQQIVDHAIREQAKQIYEVYTKAIRAMVGVGGPAAEGVDPQNFQERMGGLAEDYAAIVAEFREMITARMSESIRTMEGLLDTYRSEAPAIAAGEGGNRYASDFEAILDQQVESFQRNLEQLFTEILRANSTKIGDLKALRAQLGLPRTAQASALPTGGDRAPLSQRYQEYLAGKIQAARQSASEQLRAVIPGFKGMSLQQQTEGFQAMKARIVADMAEYRKLLEQGNVSAAKSLGEGLLQRIEAVKEAYDQLGKQFPIKRNQIRGHKGQMTKFSNEVQRGLKEVAENATGTFADQIESSLGGVGDAGESLGDAFLDEVRRAFGIQSPSKEMIEIGKQVVQGFRNGLHDGDRVISEFVRNVKVGVSDIKDVAQDMSERGKAIADEGSGVIADSIQNVVSRSQGIADDIENRGRRRASEARRHIGGMFSSAAKSRVAQELNIGGRISRAGGWASGSTDAGEFVQEGERPALLDVIGDVAGEENAVKAIGMVQSGLDGLLDRVPILKSILTLGSEVWAKLALLSASVAVLGKLLQAAGLGRFISALASLPDTAAQAGQEAESLALAFESVTGSSDIAAQSMEYVSGVARKFSVDVTAAEEAYLGLVATTRGTELEGIQTQQIFEAFAQTAALRGLSQQQQGQMFTAIQQVLGKGKLSAEEVRGQLGEIPALAFQQTLAESLGVNLQQLDKMLSQGQLGSEALVKVSQTYAAQNAQMSQGMDTAAQSATRLENAIVALQRAFGSQFLDAQREGLSFFAGALEGIAAQAGSLVALLRNGLILVLGNLTVAIAGSATALKVAQVIVVSLINSFQRLLPFLSQFAAGLVAVQVALEVWGSVLKNLQLSETGQQIRSLSLSYQELGASAEDAAEAMGLVAQVRQGASNLLNWTQERLGLKTTREFVAENVLAQGQEQTSVVNLSVAEQRSAVDAAEKMLQIEQDMIAMRTYRSTLTAADREELERTSGALQELREKYDQYLEEISQSRTGIQAAIRASRSLVEDLESSRSQSLSDAENQRITEQIEVQLRNITRLESAQSDLDQATSRLETSLSVFTTILARASQRMANVRERLTNQFNEERARLIETGLSLGQGDQTIRLQLDRADFREMQEWIHTLRVESQQLTAYLADPDVARQVSNLQERASREGTDLGTETLQAIIQENGENVEAARALLQLQDLQNQISQGETQIAQQALQFRQSARDTVRSIADFLRQITQELDEIQIQMQEQLQQLQQNLMRTQLQRAIVAGSTGVFGNIVSGVQGILDQAGEIAQRYLGQERRRLELQQRRYDLGTRMEDFSNSLMGATEAIEAFRMELLGGRGGTPSSQSLPSQVAGAVGEVLLGITGSSGRGSGPHLDIRKRGGDRPLTQAELDRFSVDGRALTSYPMTSGFGPRNTGIPGASTYHRGIDFGIGTGGRITTTVPVRSVSLRDPSQTGGGGWVTDVLFEDGLEVSLLHLDPSTQGAGIGRGTGARPSGATGAGSQRMTVSQLIGVAQAAGFSEGDARIMAAIAMAESSGNPRAHNPNASTGDNSYGLWQINMLGAMGPERRRQFGLSSNEDLFDPATNARAARGIYGTQGFGAWSVYRSGAYQQYLAEAQSASLPSSPAAQHQARAQAQGQATAANILGAMQSTIATGEGEITVAVQGFLQQIEQTMESLRRETEQAYNNNLLPAVQGMEAQVGQFLDTDAVTQQQRQLAQQFQGIGRESRQLYDQVNDSLRELQQVTEVLPPMIERLRGTGDPLDAEQADALEQSLAIAQNMMQPIEDLLGRVDAVRKALPQAQQQEQEYQQQRSQIEREITQITIEREVAQSRREAGLETELGILQEQKTLEMQILDLEREMADRPDELERRRAALQEASDRRQRALVFQQQRTELGEQEFQGGLLGQLLEARAARAEGPGGFNGIFGYRAQALRQEAAILQENLRFEGQLLELRERYQDQPELLQQLETQAIQLNQISLQNLDQQFQSLGQTIATVAEDALGTFFEEILTGSKSAGDALRGLLQSFLRFFIQMAARNVSRGILGGIGGFFGGAAYGGTVPNYAEGGRVVPGGAAALLAAIAPDVGMAFQREGKGAALGVFTPGEEILSIKTGEAQRYQMLKRTLGANPLQSIVAGNFAMGGTVGINPDLLSGNVGRSSPALSMGSVSGLGSGARYGGDRSVVVNYEIKTPDADSFRRSQYQIDRDATIAAQKVLGRK